MEPEAASATASPAQGATDNWFTTGRSAVLLRPTSLAPQRFAYAQSVVDLAVTACGLELYRLAHGQFPESLSALVPGCLGKVPADVIGGRPLAYRRTDDGRFVLYSVGWNQRDDGGASLQDGEAEQLSPARGDWVWRYP